MARMLEEFPKTTGPVKYPLDDWFNGAAWELVPDKDFHCKPSSFRNYLRGVARARGGRLKTRWGWPGVVVIQYFENEKEQAHGMEREGSQG